MSVCEKSCFAVLLRKPWLHLHWHFSLEMEYVFGTKLPTVLVSQCDIFSVCKQIPSSERKLAFDRYERTGLWPEVCVHCRGPGQRQPEILMVWHELLGIKCFAPQMCCSCGAPLADGDTARGVWLACCYRLHKQWSVTQLLTRFCSEGLCKCLNIKGKNNQVWVCWGKRVFRPQLGSNS